MTADQLNALGLHGMAKAFVDIASPARCRGTASVFEGSPTAISQNSGNTRLAMMNTGPSREVRRPVEAPVDTRLSSVGARTWRVTRRPTTGNISLRVPRKRITEFCQRHGYGNLTKKTGRAREQFLVTSDTATVFAYNSEFCGFANYYSLADDNKRALGVLELVVFRSLIKTLALRHRTTRARIMARLWKGMDYEVTW
ncbi:group II intron reverse transcriptase/maturase [Bradyrhizobium sp. RT4b]|uniref:group II intron reverse transcriptase/maturase n=1 Tax=Bradyrhizobium sp. RT4b TaxID=3156379 RepID=UPI00339B4F22